MIPQDGPGWEGVDHSVADCGRYRSWGATHPGASRTVNQDAYLNRPDMGLWAVADGAGGHQAGEVASAAAIGALMTLPAGLSHEQALSEICRGVEAVHRELLAEGARRGPHVVMATTLVVLLAAEDRFTCLWAGDSRAYLLQGNALTQITRDHSLVQELVDSGTIAAADAECHPHANVITRAVGSDTAPLELEQCSGLLAPGDRVLLCSDGLTKTLSDAQIAALLLADEDSSAERLMLAALAAQASDNVTAVTVEVLPDRRQ